MTNGFKFINDSPTPTIPVFINCNVYQFYYMYNYMIKDYKVNITLLIIINYCMHIFIDLSVPTTY